jgi:hypothetical protein
MVESSRLPGRIQWGHDTVHVDLRPFNNRQRPRTPVNVIGKLSLRGSAYGDSRAVGKRLPFLQPGGWGGAFGGVNYDLHLSFSLSLRSVSSP